MWRTLKSDLRQRLRVLRGESFVGREPSVSGILLANSKARHDVPPGLWLKAPPAVLIHDHRRLSSWLIWRKSPPVFFGLLSHHRQGCVKAQRFRGFFGSG